jgi:hypothetical protein
MLMEAKSKYSSNIKPYLKNYYILDSVDAYSNIELNYNSMLPSIKIKTKPTIFILKRRQSMEYDTRKAKIKDDKFIYKSLDYHTNSNEKAESTEVGNKKLLFSEENEESSELLKSTEEINGLLDILYSTNLKKVSDSKIIKDNESEETQETDELVENILNEATNLSDNSKLTTHSSLQSNKNKKKQSKTFDKSAELILNEIERNKPNLDYRLKTFNNNKKLNNMRGSVNNVLEDDDNRIVPKKSILHEKKINTILNKIEDEKDRINFEELLSESIHKPNAIKNVVKKFIKNNEQVYLDSLEKKNLNKDLDKVDINAELKKNDITSSKHNSDSQINIIHNNHKSNNIKNAVKKLIEDKKNEYKIKAEEQNNLLADKRNNSKIEVSKKIIREKKNVPKDSSIFQKSTYTPFKADSAEDEINQKQKITNLKEIIKNIINQLKEFEKDLIAEDTDLLNTWLEDETNPTMDTNLIELGKVLINSNDKDYKDPKKTLKEILDLFNELKKEIVSDNETAFDDIDSYLERPISETLIRFKEAFKTLIQQRKLKMQDHLSKDKRNAQQRLQSQKKAKNYKY